MKKIIACMGLTLLLSQGTGIVASCDVKYFDPKTLGGSVPVGLANLIGQNKSSYCADLLDTGFTTDDECLGNYINDNAKTIITKVLNSDFNAALKAFGPYVSSLKAYNDYTAGKIGTPTSRAADLTKALNGLTPDQAKSLLYQTVNGMCKTDKAYSSMSTVQKFMSGPVAKVQ